MRKLIKLVCPLLFIASCFPTEDNHREDGKIFHACIPNSGALGGLYFGLYNDHTYQICITGGIGQNCFSGNYVLMNDTLILIDLNKDIPLKSNKFLISHFLTENGDFGEVIQLDSETNKRFGKNETYFVIRLDSLKNIR